MATEISLTAQLRDGSMTPRALRRGRMIPGVIYGHGYEPRSLQFDHLSMDRVVRRAGLNIVVTLNIEGEDAAESVLIRDVQRNPVTESILHVDLYRIVAGEIIKSLVPLVERGRAPATDLGGIVNQSLDAVEVECLPSDMPQSIEIDLTKLVDIHSRIRVGDLSIPEGVTVLTPANAEVANIVIPRAMVEEEEVEEVERAEMVGEEKAAEAEEPTSEEES